MRTDDLTYGADYWNTLDGGAGYQDSVMWEDLAFITKEVLYYDQDGRDLSNTHNLLDMGCAHGYLVRHLRRRGIEAWGADYSQYALDNSPEDTAPYLRQFDLTSANAGVLAGHPFDRLTCYETLEHIPEQHVDTALEVLFECLKPGGVALLTICTDDRPGWDSDPTHVTIKPRQWWSDRLTKIGFRHDDRYQFLKKFHLFKDHGGVFVVSRP